MAVTYTYTTIDPASASGGASTFITGLDKAGDTVGSYAPNSTAALRGYVRLANGNVTDLNDPNSASGQPTNPASINNNNQVVGFYTKSSGTYVGFIYNVTTKTFTDVIDPSAGTNQFGGTAPTAINDSGVVTGYYTDNNGTSFGFVDNGGIFTTINAGKSGVYPVAISSNGLVVGNDSGNEGFLYVPGQGVTEIFDPKGSSTSVSGVNQAGQVVGTYYDANYIGHAFLYQNGTFTDLTPPGSSGDTISATAVNASGQVLGYYFDNNLAGASFVYDSVSKTYTTLDDGGGANHYQAKLLNDAGQAAGQNSNNGVNTTVLSTPSSPPGPALPALGASPVPTVTATNIHVTGGSGTGGAFKIGDTVTATWNNTSGGDNNSASITGVTVDFSQFGGGTAVTASNSGGTWTATYTITAGAIDDVTNRNVAVTATDSSGPTTTSGTSNVTVDDKAPTVSSIALAGTSPNNATSDTFTVTFSEGVKGVTSGAFTAVTTGGTTDTGISVTQNSASQYTVTVNGVSGSGTLGLNLNSSGTGITDLVGNAISGGLTGQTYTVDQTPPSAPSLALTQDTGASGSDKVTSNPAITYTKSVQGDTLLYSIDGQSYSSSQPSITGDGGHTVYIEEKDAAGNISTPTSLTFTLDTTAPVLGSAAVNGSTLTLTYTETGSGLAAGTNPTVGEFTVSNNSVTNVAYDATNKTVTLTLGQAVNHGDTVTVSYTPDNTSGHEIQDVAGNLAANLTNQSVTNNTVAAPSVTPAAQIGALEIGQAEVIGTVTPATPGGSVTIHQTVGTGALSLVGPTGGTYQLVYTAPGTIASSATDSLSYTLTDVSSGSTTSSLGASVPLDAGPTIAAATPGVVEKGQTTVIGTVTLGIATDTLTLTKTGGAGTLSLGAVVNGTQQVIYTAPATVATSGLDAVSYTVKDQHNDVTAAGSASVPLDAGPTIAAATPGVVEKGQTTVIGTVTLGIATDTLTLTKTGGAGTLSLGAVSNGTQQVIYTAPATVATSGLDAVSYTVKDQHNDVTAAGSASVQLDAGPTIAAATPGVVEKGQTTVIGTVTLGIATDTLTLTKTGGAGTLSLGAVSNGTQQVIYTAPATVATSGLDAVSYTVKDQHNDVTAAGSASVPLDAGPTIAAATPGVVEKNQTTVIGTVTLGIATDTLTLTKTGGTGTLSLGAVVNGTQQVIYTAPATVAASGLDAVSYTVKDQHNDVTAAGSASVQLDAGPTIAAATPGVVEKNQTTVIGTVTPGLSGDTLTLTKTGGAGTLSLGAVVNGTQQVIYTAPATVAASGLDAVSYTVSDQHNDVTAAGSASVQLDSGPIVTITSNSISVQEGQSSIIGTVKAGLDGDTLTVTPNGNFGALALATTATTSTTGIYNLVYTASTSTFANIVPANGSIIGLASFSISDQRGGQQPVAETVTVGNPTTTYTGSPVGLSTIAGTSTAAAVTISGSSNKVTFGDGYDRVTVTQTLPINAFNTITLGNGHNTITLGGTNLADTIKVGNGSNTIAGNLSTSSIQCGDGNNTITLFGLADTITVGAGTNTISAGSGLATVTAGAGTDGIALGGTLNTVNLNGSNATVTGGQGSDTVNANGGQANLTFRGPNEAANLSGNLVVSITDLAQGLRINVNSATQTDMISGFGNDPTGVVDFARGVFASNTTTAAIVSALHSDGHGGTMLALGNTGSIDFVGTAASQLHASNFKIG